MSHSPKKIGILALKCPDRKGLVATISSFLFHHNANIVHASQHRDEESGLFLMRIEWDPEESDLNEADFSEAFSTLSQKYSIQWKLAFSHVRQRISVFVSQMDHCLADLLYRNKKGELDCQISQIISNHSHAQDLAAFYGIPFYETPINPRNKTDVEKKQLEYLKRDQIDLIILARYMQILSPSFVDAYPNRIINIHHSFLPAFQGAKPYHQAFARGVKLIGATAHYVTEDLDKGPIISQDVLSISHRDRIEDFIQKGRNLETLVLSRAVKYHLEHRIAVCGNKTFILE